MKHIYLLAGREQLGNLKLSQHGRYVGREEFGMGRLAEPRTGPCTIDGARRVGPTVAGADSNSAGDRITHVRWRAKILALSVRKNRPTSRKLELGTTAKTRVC